MAQDVCIPRRCSLNASGISQLLWQNTNSYVIVYNYECICSVISLKMEFLNQNICTFERCCKINIIKLKYRQTCTYTYNPGQVAHLVGASLHRPPGYGLNSQSGHKHRLQVRSLSRACMGDNQSCFSLPLSLPLSLKSINICSGED